MLEMNQAIASIESLINKSKPSTSTTMKSAIAALYTADCGAKLRYSNCIGLLQLDYDRLLKTNMLRLYNMKTVSLVLEVELYYGFINNYMMVTPTFYIFEYPPQGIIGFLFRNKDEADLMKIKISTASPKKEDFQQMQRGKVQNSKKKKQQISFFTKLKGTKNEQSQQIQKKKINQIHLIKKDLIFDLKTSSIIANSQTDIPPQWQQLFNFMNLKQEDLQNSQILNIIIQQTILQQLKIQAQKTNDRDIQNKIKDAQQQYKKYIKIYQNIKINNLPLPPPLLLSPVVLNQNNSNYGIKRGHLLQQIKKNKFKLKYIYQINDCMHLNISNMNKQQRYDHAIKIKSKFLFQQKYKY